MSRRSENLRTEPRPPPLASRVVPQEAINELLNEIVKQGREEFAQQLIKLNELVTGPLLSLYA